MKPIQAVMEGRAIAVRYFSDMTEQEQADYVRGMT